MKIVTMQLRHLCFLCFLATNLFASCKKNSAIPLPVKNYDTAGVLIKFINSTGKDLSDVRADSKHIGTINAGDSTGYELFPKFGVDTGLPDINFQGVVEGKLLGCTSQFYWCGTEKVSSATGKYDLVVRIAHINGTPYFDLQFK